MSTVLCTGRHAMRASLLCVWAVCFCILIVSVGTGGCQARANPGHCDVRDLFVSDGKLACDLILAGSPGQVMTRYETRRNAETAEVIVFVKPRVHGRMADAFRRLEISIPPPIERVVLTDGQQVREIWHRAGTFEEACRVLETTALGTPVGEIERRLSLTPPAKTYLGAGTYHDRIFRYERQDGLRLLIGLRQRPTDCTDSDFLYLGHHTVGMGDRVWSRWATEDDVFESRTHDGLSAATQPAPKVTAPARAVEDFDQITIACSFVWGDDLLPILGFRDPSGKPQAVYAVGYVLNRSGDMAYVKARISAAWSQLSGSCEVSVGLVPPKESAAEPFVVLFRNLVRERIDLSKVTPTVELVDVRFK